MKRFWLVMLSLGLVLAFSASAMAVDVKFSGSYYAAGMYLDKTTLNKNSYTITSSFTTVANLATIATYTSLYGSTAAYGSAAAFATMGMTGQSGNSTAFYYQRLRVGTDFIVSPGLKLVTRFDALERIWGATRTAGGTAYDNGSIGTRAESENIAFDLAYIEYISPIGLFRVGYQTDGAWGTIFGNNDVNGGSVPKLTYALPIGPATIVANYVKGAERSYSYVNTTSVATDRDYDKYYLGATYNVNKDIQLGLLGVYYRIAYQKGAMDINTPGLALYPTSPMFAQAYAFSPYAKAKFGPVSIEAEAVYAFGQIDWEDNNPANNATMKIENASAYLNVMADFKMVYVGGTVAWVSGDDPGTSDQLEGGIADGGKDWNPTLIMFNYDRSYWAGSLKGYPFNFNASPYVQGTEALMGGSSGSLSNGSPMMNAYLFQGQVGVRPIAALDINFSLTYANADKKPQDVLNNSLGWEADVTGIYKITNNLTYMLGAGYFWTGAYYQGTSNTNDVQNTYILVNKLTLTF